MGKRKHPLEKMRAFYFYPNRVQSDSEHSVVVVENATSYKINDGKKAVNAHVNKRLKYSGKVNSFANSN